MPEVKTLKLVAATLFASWILCVPKLVIAAELQYEYLHATDATLAKAMQSTGWQSGKGSASFAFEGEPRWLRYTLSASEEIRIFTIDNPWLTHIDVYLVNGPSVAEVYNTGNSKPLSSRPIANSVFAFGVAPTVTHIYVYDSGESISYFPVQLMSAVQYSSFSTNLNAFHGLYYGIVLIMILYNIAMFIGTRDSAYIFYSLYATALVFFLSTADGTGALFLWPEMPGVQDIVLALSWGLSTIFLLEFATRFLELKPGGKVETIKRGLQVAAAVIALIVAFIPDLTLYLFLTVHSVITSLALLSVGIYATLTKTTNGRTFLAANGMLVIGALSLITMLVGWTQPSLVLQHAIHLGSIAELALLTLGLVRRLRESDEARFAAFKQSQELSRRNKELHTAKALAEEHRHLQKSVQ